MTNLNLSRSTLRTFTALALGAALLAGTGLATSGCVGGTAYRLNSRSRPAGDARAAVNFRQEGNVGHVRVATSRLPEPSWVRPGAKLWRVWARAGTGEWVALGDLDAGGQLGWTRGPATAFELCVTAEITPRAIGPTYAPTFVGRLP
jgi:hypothetical protein